ncbi:hypothetical protein [Muricoccus radiodurans]|uniref:hypothetical protein n=1 Tax=Muricoccus radiodurans TaxID=2231721 RepID=UPI003CEF7AA2
MIRDLHRRLQKLDGGNAKAVMLRHREEWLSWRGRPVQEWPESALEVFDRSSNLHNPLAADTLRGISDEDLDWLLARDLAQASEVMEQIQTWADTASQAQIVAMVEEYYRCHAPC